MKNKKFASFLAAAAALVLLAMPAFAADEQTELPAAEAAEVQQEQTAAPAEQEIYAETYAGGYVFYAADDGFYATEHGEWSTGVKVANYSKMADDEFVADMAYNDKDQMIYFITEYGKKFTVICRNNRTCGKSGNRNVRQSDIAVYTS